MSDKIKTYVNLARMGNVFIAFLSVESAGILSGVNVFHSLKLFLAALSASLITSGGNAINDLFDIEIDKINRPGRPVPAGKVTKKEVKSFYLATTITGVFVGGLINLQTLIISATAAAIIFLYSYRLKGIILLGNISVAAMTGLAFIYGGAAVQSFKNVYTASIFAFLSNLIREIIKDAEDASGDQAIGISTIATRYGRSVSSVLATILSIVLLGSIFIAYVAGLATIQFFLVSGLTVLPLVIYSIYLLMLRQDFSQASYAYKMIMVFGLIALLVGSYRVPG
ncbi:MAG: geranylgeranylglycerol-phosphate geranylgeranyltransferase [Candidatus Kryptoniota bacterium]